MFIEVKRYDWKARLGWLALTVAKIVVVILALFSVNSSSAANGAPQEVDGRLVPLGDVLQTDGKLNLPDGFRGSLDPQGWQLAGRMCESPHFAPLELTADGEWADTYNLPNTDSSASALVVDGAGNLYAGGGFTTAGKVIANHIAKWDGSNWSALGNGMDDDVSALAVDGSGNLYAGGYFITAGGVVVNNIAKWDGTSWSALGNGMDGGVSALAVDSAGNIYAGGSFTTAGGVSANHVARWDGSSWSALGSGMDGRVSALAVDGAGNLYAGGPIDIPGAFVLNRVAMWDGSGWSFLGTVMDDQILDLAVDGTGKIYAGGYFTTAGGVSANKIAVWDGSSWSALGSGTGGVFNQHVIALSVDKDDNLYAGGEFTTAGGVVVNNIAKWDGTSWSALGSGMDNWVGSLTVDGAGNIYAGGRFSTAGGVVANRIASWDGFGWSGLGSQGSGMSGYVNALAIDSTGVLYAGGQFTTAGGVVANRIAMWDGFVWSTLGSGIDNGRFYALIFDGVGNLYAGGGFTTVGGVSANNIAKWDGSSWLALGSGVGDGVNALVFDDAGNLYAGGSFSTAGGAVANNIAKWDGSSWSALGSGMGGDYPFVRALAVDDEGNLYAGGKFSTAGGVSADNIAKWDGSGWSALGSGMNDYVRALTVDSDGNLYAGGNFSTAGGAVANNIAMWDGASWSALGSGIGGDYPFVRALAVDGEGNLYAGGEFTTAGGVIADNIAKWDGSGWSDLGSGMNDEVRVLMFDGTGNLYAGGQFTIAGGKPSAHIGLWITSITAAFSGSPLLGVAPLTVDFTNYSSGNFDTCSWDFGDGGTSSSCGNPSYEYTTAGVYTVSLEASGPGGSTIETKTDYIAVYEPVNADFSGSPRSGVAPLMVDFSNNSAGDYDSCDWDFGDGGTSNNCVDPSYNYNQAGTYTVALTVSGPGGTDVHTRSNYITVYEPVNADFSATPTGGVAPLAVDFSNLSTGDFDTCDWEFGDGGTSDSCLNPSYTYVQTGTFTVTLTVSGLGGSDILAKQDFILVDEPGTPPVADFSATTTNGLVPLTVDFINLSSGDYDTCEWGFGDGGETDECFGISHTYSILGTYTVTLTIDGSFGKDTSSKPNYISVEPYQLFVPMILKSP
jgi:PKD repeat protein